MGKRHKGRILAFQAIYAWDTQHSLSSQHTQSPVDNKEQVLKDLLDFSWAEKELPVNKSGKSGKEEDPAGDFSRLLAAGTVENIKTVDAMIRKHLLHWDFSRLNSVDRALLRLSIYELLFQTAPASVVIDEAVDIAREYGTDDSYRFINGVLDGIKKTIQNGITD
ncbi:MAG: transcription antitermination factor NusB [Treponema sp.]|nr:transcription antitermination factor NusB [Treponema sp.]